MMSCGSRARENSDEKFPSTHGITSSNSTSIIIPTFWRRYLTGIPTPNALPHWIRPRRLLPHCVWWYSDGKGGAGTRFYTPRGARDLRCPMATQGAEITGCWGIATRSDGHGKVVRRIPFPGHATRRRRVCHQGPTRQRPESKKKQRRRELMGRWEGGKTGIGPNTRLGPS
jgi:hypothetical protein